MRVVVLAGGYGGAKLSHGLALASERGAPLELAVVVNVADDLELHGLHVSPDIDTVMYTLAGLANEETGWGVRDETWSAAGMLERYGAPTWFRLGDRDLATHIRRTEAIRAGGSLTDVTRDLATALGVRAVLLPATDDRVQTRLRTDDGWLDFQDYFVRRHHRDTVHEIVYEGIDSARPTTAALRAIAEADLIALAPSNPFLSVGPILDMPGMADAVRAARAPRVAVSPIVGGRALRGPADRLFVSLDGEPSAAGVARHYTERYPGLLDGLVIDTADAGLAPDIEALGVQVLVADTVMRSVDDRERLARDLLSWAEAGFAPQSAG
jgi:LPPG:FO 2-phospho-L-lactate transferase